jgi:uncharacterized protein (DUF1330 family)
MRGMPAYLIANVDVKDAAAYEKYRELAPATIEQFGGRFLARGGQVESLEGDWAAKRLVIIEFPSMDRAKAWWSSDEYGPAKALRQSVAVSSLTLVDGI